MIVPAMLTLLSFPQGPCGTIEALENARRGEVPLARPTRAFTVSSTHFIVHYDTTGTHATTTAYANTVINMFEYSWEIQCDTLGWDEPPPDNGKGGDDRYDVYISYFSGGILGVTYFDGLGPDPTQEDAQSYIAVLKNMNTGTAKATVSHEFNHACQYSYSYNESNYFYENCATWMEDEVYDDINQYVGYIWGIPSPITRPEYPLSDGTGLYWYAGCTWPMFLTEWVDDSVVRDIWALAATHFGNWLHDDLDQILQGRSRSFTEAIKVYSIWRFFTGNRSDTTTYYSEAHLWPASGVLGRYSAYPDSGTQGFRPPKGPGGTDYILCSSLPETLVVGFDGDDNYYWAAQVIGMRNGPAPDDTFDIPLDGGYYGSASFYTVGYDTLILAPVVTWWGSTTPSLNFNFWLGTPGQAVTERGSSPQVRFTGKRFLFTLPSAQQVTLVLYRADGRLASTLVDGALSAGSHVVSVGALRPGAYFWRLTVGDARYAGRFVGGL